MQEPEDREHHIPVLLEEFLSFFINKELEIFIDGTLGAGGHTAALLQAHPELKKVIGFDQDPYALSIAKERLSVYGSRFLAINRNFKFLKEELEKQNIDGVDGIFLDIGLSSMQLDRGERGFSFMKEGPLDMRMNPEQDLTAKKVLNQYSEKELGYIFKEYGEIPKWRVVAKAVVDGRKKKSIATISALNDILMPIIGKARKRIHPLTLVFQALRICVNDELNVLKEVIPQAIDLLRSGGRLGIITFHSLEDRIVKNQFKEAAGKPVPDMDILREKKAVQIIRLLTKKPIVADKKETKKNARARSAKLRFIEKI